MAKKVLVVTKDVGEFNVYEPVVRDLRQRDVECAIIAEGLSKQKWSGVSQMTVSGEVFSEPEINNLFLTNRPDLALTGLGVPINLGEKFGIAANAHKVKLGYIHDLWGVHKRSSAVPDFVCVTDNYDAQLVREYPNYSERSPRIYVTGSPAMDELKNVSIDLNLDRMLEGQISVLVLGQDESTTPMLQGLIEILDGLGTSNYVLIPRLHPKFRANTELWNVWLNLLNSAKKGKVLQVEDAVSTRSLMRSAEYTVSVYSTGLIEAAMLGSFTVSYVSDLGREKMKAALGVEKFPLVSVAATVEVNSPTELAEVLRMTPAERGQSVRRIQSQLQADGKNTERVVAAILKELGL